MKYNKLYYFCKDMNRKYVCYSTDVAFYKIDEFDSRLVLFGAKEKMIELSELYDWIVFSIIFDGGLEEQIN